MNLKFVSEVSSAKTMIVPVSKAGGNIKISAPYPIMQLHEKASAKGLLKGKTDEIVHIPSLDEAFPDVFFITLKEEAPTDLEFKQLGGRVYTLLQQNNLTSAVVSLEAVKHAIPDEKAVAQFALGFMLKNWHFDHYFSEAKEDKRNKHHMEELTFICKDPTATHALSERARAIVEGVSMARHLVSEPGNVIYPETFVERAKELKKLGVSIDVLGEKKMQKLGMGALLAVGQGSEKESQLLIMEYRGGKKGEQPVAFVGKGVTFDTGGISLKPSDRMWDMKYDMAGGAAVVGTMRALAAMKAPINAVGVVGLAENMPSGSAQRPGDIVKSMSGQTIECLNTDAEGRMVLADALWYTQDRFNPTWMVDLATLTGAITVALGNEYAGLFSNDDVLSEKLLTSGKEVGERLWRFPMGPEYDKAIDSNAADVQNISKPGTGAGSITAAQFLQRFVNNKPWAHLDIAGMAWTNTPKATTPAGATGFGVELLVNMVAKDY